MKYIHIKGKPFPFYLKSESEVNINTIEEDYTVVEVPNNINPKLLHYKYFDMIGDEVFVFNYDRYKKDFLIEKIDEFKDFRERQFKGWDILKSNIAVGIDEPLTQEEIDWYRKILEFKNLITTETTEDDYPKTPQRVLDYS